MKLVIMGPPGSGKSTQAELIAKACDFVHVSTGVIFRSLKNDNSELAKRIEGILASGLLVSDEDTMQVVKARMEKEDVCKNFVLDGFPRNLYQAENSPVAIDKVFYLEISDETAMKRLLSRGEGRQDDTKDVIEVRLVEYHKLTEPVLEFFEKQGKLERIDGEQTIEAITKDILKIIK